MNEQEVTPASKTRNSGEEFIAEWVAAQLEQDRQPAGTPNERTRS